ncbi:hypothetical protein ZHAS_00005494 [Anopheles sinensis]|uniref:Uncharacterized protein n=1 Tax=Anopheles sinensis TaxID=74873 RepID=A0A084VJN9_ANOSI|nr:hypothetical protein ZHAS_00005494 [Anopheles sinensis]
MPTMLERPASRNSARWQVVCPNPKPSGLKRPQWVGNGQATVGQAASSPPIASALSQTKPPPSPSKHLALEPPSAISGIGGKRGALWRRVWGFRAYAPGVAILENYASNPRLACVHHSHVPGVREVDGPLRGWGRTVPYRDNGSAIATLRKQVAEYQQQLHQSHPAPSSSSSSTAQQPSSSSSSSKHSGDQALLPAASSSGHPAKPSTVSTIGSLLAFFTFAPRLACGSVMMFHPYRRGFYFTSSYQRVKRSLPAHAPACRVESRKAYRKANRATESPF